MKLRDLPEDFRGWIRVVEGHKRGLLRRRSDVLLVGDINPLGGVCDDCSAVCLDDEIEIIKRIERKENPA